LRHSRKRVAGLASVAACVVFALAGCGDSSIDEETAANESQAAERGDCGELNLAVNPWVGFEADAYVVGRVAAEELGCKVNYKNLKEDVSWQGFGTGEVDVVLEDW
jgi:glycine betaine/proline transport system substrate-binding protein